MLLLGFGVAYHNLAMAMMGENIVEPEDLKRGFQ